jgi:hypothetical protein
VRGKERNPVQANWEKWPEMALIRRAMIYRHSWGMEWTERTNLSRYPVVFSQEEWWNFVGKDKNGPFQGHYIFLTA